MPVPPEFDFFTPSELFWGEGGPVKSEIRNKSEIQNGNGQNKIHLPIGGSLQGRTAPTGRTFYSPGQRPGKRARPTIHPLALKGRDRSVLACQGIFISSLAPSAPVLRSFSAGGPFCGYALCSEIRMETAGPCRACRPTCPS